MFEVIHVVGGGARNRLLCQLTADLTGRPVFAGPIEATALGNVLAQAMATGEVADLAQARELSAVSKLAALRSLEPNSNRRSFTTGF